MELTWEFHVLSPGIYFPSTLVRYFVILETKLKSIISTFLIVNKHAKCDDKKYFIVSSFTVYSAPFSILILLLVILMSELYWPHGTAEDGCCCFNLHTTRLYKRTGCS